MSVENINPCPHLCEIKKSVELGRYLVASEDIEARELLISEKPLVSGPADEDTKTDPEKGPMCLGCNKRMAKDVWTPCGKCGWPVCSYKCENEDELMKHFFSLQNSFMEYNPPSAFDHYRYFIHRNHKEKACAERHAQNECQVFQANSVVYPCRHTWPVVNKSILVLRTLLLKAKFPSLWENIILKLEHHTEIRQTKPYCVKGDELILDNLSDFLNDCGYELAKEVIRISGIINVNAFSAMKSDFQGNSRIVQCIYPQASLLAHSCIPNSSWSINVDSDDLLISIRTTVPIKKGEMITIAYNVPETMCGTLHRLVSTEDVAHFICKCVRCVDPTEMGTYVSAIKCFNCEADYLLPECPLDPDSEWRCRNCSHNQNVANIVLFLSHIEDAFEAIKRQYNSRRTEIKKLETLIRLKGNLLHQNHYILQEVRMRIINIQTQVLEDLTEEDLENFINHCKIMLRIADVLMPGFSKTRALLQFFLSQGLMRKVSMQKQCPGTNEENQEDNFKKMHQTIYFLQTRALLFFKTQLVNGSGMKNRGAKQFADCIQRQLKDLDVDSFM